MPMYGSTVIVKKRLKPAANTAIAHGRPERGKPLELNGTEVEDDLALLDTARRVRVHSFDPRPRTLELRGRNSQHALIGETLNFPAGGGTVSSFFDYRLVTKVISNDEEPWTGDIQVGTSEIGSTAPQIMAHYQAIFNIGFDVTVDGIANCCIEATRDIPYALPYIYSDGHTFIQPRVHWFRWTTLEDITSEKFSDIDSPINAWRLTVNSGDGLCVARAIPIGLRT